MATRQRRATLPKLPQLPSAPRAGGGVKTPRIPRQRRTAEAQRPYPPPPQDWLYSLGEWVVYYFLTRIKGWQKIGATDDDYSTTTVIPGRTFYQQVRIPALGIFVNTDETRLDFVVPQSRGGAWRSVGIDPFSDFTHPNPSLDLLKRTVLEQQQNMRLVFIEDARLEAGDFEVIEQALRGIDESSRGSGG